MTKSATIYANKCCQVSGKKEQHSMPRDSGESSCYIGYADEEEARLYHGTWTCGTTKGAFAAPAVTENLLLKTNCSLLLKNSKKLEQVE